MIETKTNKKAIVTPSSSTKQSAKWNESWEKLLNQLNSNPSVSNLKKVDFALKPCVPGKVMHLVAIEEYENQQRKIVIPFQGKVPTFTSFHRKVSKYINDLHDVNKQNRIKSLLNTVHHTDCLELMKKIPDRSVQVIFADPPFNVNKKYNSYNDNLSDDEYWSWTEEWLGECVRILRDDGSLFLYNIPRHLVKAVGILNGLMDFQHWIAWNSVGKPLGRTLQLSHYGILYYAKSEADLKYYDVRAPHKTCRLCEAYLKDYGGKEHLRHHFGTLIGDVWDDLHRVRHASKRIKNHPCQLPVHLIERILLLSSDVGDIVFDPFCGGGSMAVASAHLGRCYIGAEIDKDYVDISNHKLRSAEESKFGSIYVSTHLNKVVSIRDQDLYILMNENDNFNFSKVT